MCPKDPKRALGPMFPKGCLNLQLVSYPQVAINIVTDVAIFVLPLPTILSLSLSKKDQSMLFEKCPAGSFALWNESAVFGALTRSE